MVLGSLYEWAAGFSMVLGSLYEFPAGFSMVLGSLYEFPTSFAMVFKQSLWISYKLFAMVLNSLCEFPASFEVLNNLWSQMLSWTGFYTATPNLIKFGFQRKFKGNWKWFLEGGGLLLRPLYGHFSITATILDQIDF